MNSRGVIVFFFVAAAAAWCALDIFRPWFMYQACMQTACIGPCQLGRPGAMRQPLGYLGEDLCSECVLRCQEEARHGS